LIAQGSPFAVCGAIVRPEPDAPDALLPVVVAMPGTPATALCLLPSLSSYHRQHSFITDCYLPAQNSWEAVFLLRQSPGGTGALDYGIIPAGIALAKHYAQGLILGCCLAT